MQPQRLTDMIPRICHCRLARALQVEELDEGHAILSFDPTRCESLPAVFDHSLLLKLADAAMFVSLVGSAGASAQSRAAQVRMRSFEAPMPDRFVVETRVTTLRGGLGCTEATIRADGPDEASRRVIAHASGTYRIPTGVHSAIIPAAG